MAKKKAANRLTIAEATRRTWRALGPKAFGADVARVVKKKYGFVVPSSTISLAKHAVFGPTFAMRAAKLAKVTIRKRLDQLTSKADLIRELLASGLDSPVEVAEAARAMGVIVAANHVSMIKHEVATEKPRRAKPARPPLRLSPSAGPKVARASEALSGASELAVENAALKLVLQAGSVQAAMKALGRLK